MKSLVSQFQPLFFALLSSCFLFVLSQKPIQVNPPLVGFESGFDDLITLFGNLPAFDASTLIYEIDVLIQPSSTPYDLQEILISDSLWPQLAFRADNSTASTLGVTIQGLRFPVHNSAQIASFYGIVFVNSWFSVGGLLVLDSCSFSIPTGSSYQLMIQGKDNGEIVLRNSVFKDSKIQYDVDSTVVPSVFILLQDDCQMQIQSCQFYHNSLQGWNGFISLVSGNPQIEIINSFFLDNFAAVSNAKFSALILSAQAGQVKVSNSQISGTGYQGAILFSFVETLATFNNTLFTSGTSAFANAAPTSEGLIVLQKSTLEIVSCTVSGTKAAAFIFSTGDNSISIHDSTFTDNNVNKPGFFLFYFDVSTVADAFSATISNCIFTNNQGIFSIQSPLASDPQSSFVYVKNSTFTSNRRDTASILAYSSTLAAIFENCIFQNNTCTLSSCQNVMDSASLDASQSKNLYDTNGLFEVTSATNGSLFFSNCTFQSNQAGRGAILKGCESVLALLKFKSCTFLDNVAYEGGVLLLDSAAGSIQLVESTFVNNSATRGGVAFLVGTSALSSVNCVYATNYALSGGAVFFQGDTSFVAVSGGGMSNNLALQSGGCFQVTNQANVSLSFISFSSNSAILGAVFDFIDNSSSLVLNCQFVTNRAIDGGGILHITTVGTASFQRCTFTNNYSGSSGSIFVSEQTQTIANDSFLFQNCIFKTNLAKDFSAMVMIGLSKLTVDSCYFDSNVANLGAVFRLVHHSSLLVKNTTFVGNRARYGSVFLLNNGSPQVVCQNCTIRKNIAVWGGAVVQSGDLSGVPSFTLISSLVESNQASAGDGGAFWVSESNLKLVNSTFSNNVASQDGGAIFFYDSNVQKRKSFSATLTSFVGNSAGNNGGAFGLQRFAKFEPVFRNCNFTKNSATIGGAISVFNSDGVTMKLKMVLNVGFDSNVAANYGPNIATGIHSMKFSFEDTAPTTTTTSNNNQTNTTTTAINQTHPLLVQNGANLTFLRISIYDAYGSPAILSETKNQLIGISLLSSLKQSNPSVAQFYTPETTVKPTQKGLVEFKVLKILMAISSSNRSTRASRSDADPTFNATASLLTDGHKVDQKQPSAIASFSTSTATSSSAAASQPSAAAVGYLVAKIDSLNISASIPIHVTTCQDGYKLVPTQLNGVWFESCEVDPKTYKIPMTIVIAMMVLSMVGIVLASGSALMVVLNLDHKTIKAASPKFMLIMIQGVVLGYMCMVFQVSENTTFMCVSRAWCGHLSFAILMGALFTKCWRIKLIFLNRNKKNVADSVRDSVLFAIFFGIVLFIALYLALWTSFSMPVSYLVQDSANPLLQYRLCHHKSRLWLFALYGIECSMLLWGSYLAYTTRNVPGSFNESKLIGFSIWNIIFVGSAALGYSTFAGNNVLISAILSASAIFMVLTSMLALLFGPKMVKIYFGKKQK